MGLFEQLPYVNFHELNLDWIVKEVLKVSAGFDDLSAEFVELKNYVDNYLDSVDFVQIVSDKLDEMLLNGDLAFLISQFITITNPQIDSILGGTY